MAVGYSEGEKRKVAAIVAGGMGRQHTDGSVRRELAPLCGQTAFLRRAKRGEVLLLNGDPADRVVLFLCGRCAVSRYSAEGDNLSYAVHEEAILLGLLEYLGGQPAVLATVSALDECWYLTFPGELFLEAVLSDRELTLKILRFLASFAGGSIDRVNELAQYTNRENVLLCLYRYSRGQPLPFVFKKSKRALAEELAMNLRTLYRQLDAIEGEGLIQRVGGKIWIGERESGRLEEAASRLL
ncbi:Crp/Fnr family transcriptional regulator [Bittarella sp. HCP28S3_D9]|uniref:Crp/Fnr family transcriptional regulator n=1 Tax=Bittarella sp. HCP28S3_D9 TaxID=3440253 RepID=UPI003F8C3842